MKINAIEAVQTPSKNAASGALFFTVRTDRTFLIYSLSPPVGQPETPKLQIKLVYSHG